MASTWPSWLKHNTLNVMVCQWASDTWIAQACMPSVTTPIRKPTHKFAFPIPGFNAEREYQQDSPDLLMPNLYLAYKMNNATIPPERGYPFQLVAESKWGYKWIKWIVRIELSDDPSYRGFWESRGFSNDGDAAGRTFGD